MTQSVNICKDQTFVQWWELKKRKILNPSKKVQVTSTDSVLSVSPPEGSSTAASSHHVPSAPHAHGPGTPWPADRAAVDAH